MNDPIGDTVYAFLVDGEGIAGFRGPDGWMPMVCGSERVARKLAPIAADLAKVMSKTIRLVRFARQVEVQEFKP